MQGEHYAAEGSQPVYQAEGSQPVAAATVVQQEPVVLSGTVVGMEQPAATTYAVQQPGKIPVVIAGAPPPTMVVQQPPVVMVSGVVQPAAPAPAGRYLGGNACGCCDPPGGPPLCCTTFWCPCVVVGQLWHRIVERGGGGTVLGILCGVTVGAYVLDCVEIKILRRVRAESSRRPPRHRLLDGAASSPPNALVDFHTGHGARASQAQRRGLRAAPAGRGAGRPAHLTGHGRAKPLPELRGLVSILVGDDAACGIRARLNCLCVY